MNDFKQKYSQTSAAIYMRKWYRRNRTAILRRLSIARAKHPERQHQNNKRSRTKRIAQFQQWKAQQQCTDCHKKFPHYVLEFDHVRGRKSFTIADGMRVSWKRLVTEIAKCDIVCANCHNARTWKRKSR